MVGITVIMCHIINEILWRDWSICSYDLLYLVRLQVDINQIVSHFQIIKLLTTLSKKRFTFCETSGSTSALMGTLKKRMLFPFSPTVICRTLNMLRNDCSTTGSFPNSFPTKYCFLAEYRNERPSVLRYWESWNFAFWRVIGGRQNRHTLGGVR